MDIAALQTEVEDVSAYYGERHGIERTDDWLLLKLSEEVGELTQAYLARGGQARDKGRSADEREQDFRSELADVLAQVLLIAERFDVDLAAEVGDKWLVWKREIPGSQGDVIETPTWDDRVAAFWDAADDDQPDLALARMSELVSERPARDPDALYEWASVHDFLGREAEAVPLYRAALDAGLSGDRRPQAVIQLASSLRNIGEPEEAVALLADHQPEPVTGSAADAFRALALHDAGRTDEALRAALRALAPTLPLYRRSIEGYADDLTR